MKKIIFLTVTLMLSLSIFAQNLITGKVTESGSDYPLLGVNVSLEGTTIGTTTDNDGNYSISVKPEHKNIVFQFVGFQTVVEPLDGRSVINVELGESSSVLDQVVISASKRKEKVLNAPASVSIISAERIQKQTALTPIDNMKKTPGVDIMTTGLVSANVNLRGFNGFFNGSMLTMVDNRIGRVPSLRVNAFQLIPGNNYDYEKIEIIRGPGSALYGPNAADGVMHIITKSPLDIKGEKHETTLSLTTGLRRVVLNDDLSEIPTGSTLKNNDWKTVIKPEFRSAIKINDQFGFKLSGRYMQGEDWELYDPIAEPVIGSVMRFGSAREGRPWEIDESYDFETFDRDFSITNYNLDFRGDYRSKDNDTEVIFAFGNSNSSNLEITGLAPARTSGWNYLYGQSRFRYKNFFAQYFINASDAGNQTYLIPNSGGYTPDDTLDIQLLVDKSKLNVVQLQNSNEINDLKLIYGLDYLATRPRTEGTINGRNENFDDFNQYGGYLQAEYKFSEKFKLVGASRLDYTDLTDEFQVSPRVAAVYKPDPKHTIRATYNKAFSTPSNFAFSLDLANEHPLWNGGSSSVDYYLPNGTLSNTDILNPRGIKMNITGSSNSAGYNYVRNENDEVLYYNFLDDEMKSLENTTNNSAYLEHMTDIIAAQLAANPVVPAELQSQVPLLVKLVFQDVIADITDIGLAGTDFNQYLSGADARETLYNGTGEIKNLKDFDKQLSETTETYELGYKGIIKDKLYISTDFYFTQKKNIRSGLRARSPFVTFNPIQLYDLMVEDRDGNGISDITDNINIAQLAVPFDLADVLEGDPNYVVDKNGDVTDEIIDILMAVNAQVGVGLATPYNSDSLDRQTVDEEGNFVSGNLVQNDMVLTYVNLGNANIFGSDIGFTYVFNDNVQLQGALSLVNATELEGKDNDGNPNGEIIYFNAPAKKFSLGLDHKFPNTGLSYGLNFRINESYYANSAPYIGRVNNIVNFDAKISYEPKTIKGLQLTLDINNLFSMNYYDGVTEWGRFQNFPGTPFQGRIGFLNVAYTFGK